MPAIRHRLAIIDVALKPELIETEAPAFIVAATEHSIITVAPIASVGSFTHRESIEMRAGVTAIHGAEPWTDNEQVMVSAFFGHVRGSLCLAGGVAGAVDSEAEN